MWSFSLILVLTILIQSIYETEENKTSQRKTISVTLRLTCRQFTVFNLTNKNVTGLTEQLLIKKCQVSKCFVKDKSKNRKQYHESTYQTFHSNETYLLTYIPIPQCDHQYGHVMTHRHACKSHCLPYDRRKLSRIRPCWNLCEKRTLYKMHSPRLICINSQYRHKSNIKCNYQNILDIIRILQRIKMCNIKDYFFTFLRNRTAFNTLLFNAVAVLGTYLLLLYSCLTVLLAFILCLHFCFERKRNDFKCGHIHSLLVFTFTISVAVADISQTVYSTRYTTDIKLNPSESVKEVDSVFIIPTASTNKKEISKLEEVSQYQKIEVTEKTRKSVVLKQVSSKSDVKSTIVPFKVTEDIQASESSQAAFSSSLYSSYSAGYSDSLRKHNTISTHFTPFYINVTMSTSVTETSSLLSQEQDISAADFTDSSFLRNYEDWKEELKWTVLPISKTSTYNIITDSIVDKDPKDMETSHEFDSIQSLASAVDYETKLILNPTPVLLKRSTLVSQFSAVMQINSSLSISRYVEVNKSISIKNATTVKFSKSVIGTESNSNDNSSKSIYIAVSTLLSKSLDTLDTSISKYANLQSSSSFLDVQLSNTAPSFSEASLKDIPFNEKGRNVTFPTTESMPVIAKTSIVENSMQMSIIEKVANAFVTLSESTDYLTVSKQDSLDTTMLIKPTSAMHIDSVMAKVNSKSFHTRHTCVENVSDHVPTTHSDPPRSESSFTNMAINDATQTYGIVEKPKNTTNAILSHPSLVMNTKDEIQNEPQSSIMSISEEDNISLTSNEVNELVSSLLSQSPERSYLYSEIVSSNDARVDVHLDASFTRILTTSLTVNPSLVSSTTEGYGYISDRKSSVIKNTKLTQLNTKHSNICLECNSSVNPNENFSSTYSTTNHDILNSATVIDHAIENELANSAHKQKLPVQISPTSSLPILPSLPLGSSIDTIKYSHKTPLHKNINSQSLKSVNVFQDTTQSSSSHETKVQSKNDLQDNLAESYMKTSIKDVIQSFTNTLLHEQSSKLIADTLLSSSDIFSIQSEEIKSKNISFKAIEHKSNSTELLNPSETIKLTKTYLYQTSESKEEAIFSSLGNLSSSKHDTYLLRSAITEAIQSTSSDKFNSNAPQLFKDSMFTLLLDQYNMNNKANVPGLFSSFTSLPFYPLSTLQTPALSNAGSIHQTKDLIDSISKSKVLTMNKTFFSSTFDINSTAPSHSEFRMSDMDELITNMVFETTQLENSISIPNVTEKSIIDENQTNRMEAEIVTLSSKMVDSEPLNIQTTSHRINDSIREESMFSNKTSLPNLILLKPSFTSSHSLTYDDEAISNTDEYFDSTNMIDNDHNKLLRPSQTYLSIPILTFDKTKQSQRLVETSEVFSFTKQNTITDFSKELSQNIDYHISSPVSTQLNSKSDISSLQLIEETHIQTPYLTPVSFRNEIIESSRLAPTKLFQESTSQEIISSQVPSVPKGKQFKSSLELENGVLLSNLINTFPSKDINTYINSEYALNDQIVSSNAIKRLFKQTKSENVPFQQLTYSPITTFSSNFKRLSKGKTHFDLLKSSIQELTVSDVVLSTSLSLSMHLPPSSEYSSSKETSRLVKNTFNVFIEASRESLSTTGQALNSMLRFRDEFDGRTKHLQFNQYFRNDYFTSTTETPWAILSPSRISLNPLSSFTESSHILMNERFLSGTIKSPTNYLEPKEVSVMLSSSASPYDLISSEPTAEISSESQDLHNLTTSNESFSSDLNMNISATAKSKYSTFSIIQTIANIFSSFTTVLPIKSISSEYTNNVSKLLTHSSALNILNTIDYSVSSVYTSSSITVSSKIEELLKANVVRNTAISHSQTSLYPEPSLMVNKYAFFSIDSSSAIRIGQTQKAATSSMLDFNKVTDFSFTSIMPSPVSSTVSPSLPDQTDKYNGFMSNQTVSQTMSNFANRTTIKINSTTSLQFFAKEIHPSEAVSFDFIQYDTVSSKSTTSLFSSTNFQHIGPVLSLTQNVNSKFESTFTEVAEASPTISAKQIFNQSKYSDIDSRLYIKDNEITMEDQSYFPSTKRSSNTEENQIRTNIVSSRTLELMPPIESLITTSTIVNTTEAFSISTTEISSAETLSPATSYRVSSNYMYSTKAFSTALASIQATSITYVTPNSTMTSTEVATTNTSTRTTAKTTAISTAGTGNSTIASFTTATSETGFLTSVNPTQSSNIAVLLSVTLTTTLPQTLSAEGASAKVILIPKTSSPITPTPSTSSSSARTAELLNSNSTIALRAPTSTSQISTKETSSTVASTNALSLQSTLISANSSTTSLTAYSVPDITATVTSTTTESASVTATYTSTPATSTSTTSTKTFMAAVSIAAGDSKNKSSSPASTTGPSKIEFSTQATLTPATTFSNVSSVAYTTAALPSTTTELMSSTKATSTSSASMSVTTVGTYEAGNSKSTTSMLASKAVTTKQFSLTSEASSTTSLDVGFQMGNSKTKNSSTASTIGNPTSKTLKKETSSTMNYTTTFQTSATLTSAKLPTAYSKVSPEPKIATTMILTTTKSTSATSTATSTLSTSTYSSSSSASTVAETAESGNSNNIIKIPFSTTVTLTAANSTTAALSTTLLATGSPAAKNAKPKTSPTATSITTQASGTSTTKHSSTATPRTAFSTSATEYSAEEATAVGNPKPKTISSVTATATSTSEPTTTETSTTETSTSEPTTTETSTTETSTSEPSTTETSTSDPSTSEPSTTETSTSDPSTTETSTTENSKTDTSKSEPSTTETSTTETSTSEPSTTEISTTETSTSEPSTTETSTSDPSTSEPSTTETSTSDPSTTETSTTENSKTDTSTSEPSTTETSTTETSTSEPSTTETSITETSTSEPSTTATSTTETSTTATSTTVISTNDIPTSEINLLSVGVQVKQSVDIADEMFIHSMQTGLLICFFEGLERESNYNRRKRNSVEELNGYSKTMVKVIKVERRRSNTLNVDVTFYVTHDTKPLPGVSAQAVYDSLSLVESSAFLGFPVYSKVKALISPPPADMPVPEEPTSPVIIVLILIPILLVILAASVVVYLYWYEPRRKGIRTKTPWQLPTFPSMRKPKLDDFDLMIDIENGKVVSRSSTKLYAENKLCIDMCSDSPSNQNIPPKEILALERAFSKANMLSQLEQRHGFHETTLTNNPSKLMECPCDTSTMKVKANIHNNEPDKHKHKSVKGNAGKSRKQKSTIPAKYSNDINENKLYTSNEHSLPSPDVIPEKDCTLYNYKNTNAHGTQINYRKICEKTATDKKRMLPILTQNHSYEDLSEPSMTDFEVSDNESFDSKEAYNSGEDESIDIDFSLGDNGNHVTNKLVDRTKKEMHCTDSVEDILRQLRERSPLCRVSSGTFKAKRRQKRKQLGESFIECVDTTVYLEGLPNPRHSSIDITDSMYSGSLAPKLAVEGYCNKVLQKPFYSSLTLSKPPRNVNNFIEGDLEDDVFLPEGKEPPISCQSHHIQNEVSKLNTDCKVVENTKKLKTKDSDLPDYCVPWDLFGNRFQRLLQRSENLYVDGSDYAGDEFETVKFTNQLNSNISKTSKTSTYSQQVKVPTTNMNAEMVTNNPGMFEHVTKMSRIGNRQISANVNAEFGPQFRALPFQAIRPSTRPSTRATSPVESFKALPDHINQLLKNRELRTETESVEDDPRVIVESPEGLVSEKTIDEVTTEPVEPLKTHCFSVLLDERMDHQESVLRRSHTGHRSGDRTPSGPYEEIKLGRNMRAAPRGSLGRIGVSRTTQADNYGNKTPNRSQELSQAFMSLSTHDSYQSIKTEEPIEKTDDRQRHLEEELQKLREAETRKKLDLVMPSRDKYIEIHDKPQSPHSSDDEEQQKTDKDTETKEDKPENKAEELLPLEIQTREVTAPPPALEDLYSYTPKKSSENFDQKLSPKYSSETEQQNSSSRKLSENVELSNISKKSSENFDAVSTQPFSFRESGRDNKENVEAFSSSFTAVKSEIDSSTGAGVSKQETVDDVDEIEEEIEGENDIEKDKTNLSDDDFEF